MCAAEPVTRIAVPHHYPHFLEGVDCQQNLPLYADVRPIFDNAVHALSGRILEQCRLTTGVAPDYEPSKLAQFHIQGGVSHTNSSGGADGGGDGGSKGSEGDYESYCDYSRLVGAWCKKGEWNSPGCTYNPHEAAEAAKAKAQANANANPETRGAAEGAEAVNNNKRYTHRAFIFLSIIMIGSQRH